MHSPRYTDYHVALLAYSRTRPVPSRVLTSLCGTRLLVEYPDGTFLAFSRPPNAWTPLEERPQGPLVEAEGQLAFVPLLGQHDMRGAELRDIQQGHDMQGVDPLSEEELGAYLAYQQAAQHRLEDRGELERPPNALVYWDRVKRAALADPAGTRAQLAAFRAHLPQGQASLADKPCHPLGWLKGAS